FGCNLAYPFAVGKKPVNLTINVQIPYMPITSNGKEPDLELFIKDITATVEAAANRCQRATRAAEDPADSILPKAPRGRPSEEKRKAYEEAVARFADSLKEITSRLDFKLSSRGLCYILENDHRLPKGDFDAAQKLITECRKNGLLPIDFTAEDEARS